MRRFACFAVASLATAALADPGWMPAEPGPAKSKSTAAGISLETGALRFYWKTVSPGKPSGLSVRNLWDGNSVLLGYGTDSTTPFALLTRDGRVDHLTVTVAPHLTEVSGGSAIEGEWTGPVTGGQAPMTAVWRLILKDGDHFGREELTIKAGAVDYDPAGIDITETMSHDASVVGTVPGSPIVVGNVFFGAENPMSGSEIAHGSADSIIHRKLPIKAGTSVTYTSVIGVSPAGQMRRSFNAYVEKQRARPYKPFLHYNSWYDLGYFNRYTADECVERIHTFGEELATKRGVKLSSFLFDDGWDNPNTVWEFTKDFPKGFLPLKDEAAKYGAEPGAWLSPWGGYGTPRKERLAAGAKAGMEIDSEGYALSGPRYYDRFHQVCLDLVKNQGINQFKFDGTGSPDKKFPGGAFDSDFEAAIQLIQDLRQAKPGLFINLTTGTWPSPFWTRYADSIWRGGEDHSFAGEGPDRERWITYRDGDTFHGIVQKGPLFPINSLMLHGLIYAQHAHNLSTDPTGAFRHELRSYFGTGTQLQEMYITPSLLTKDNWDDLGESAKWSQRNADVLVDNHWVGGDPLKGEVYGWAAWSPRKAILTLRNPSPHTQSFLLDPTMAFEIPTSTPALEWTQNWDLAPAFGDGEHIRVARGAKRVVVLRPFEVLNLEGRTSKPAIRPPAGSQLAAPPQRSQRRNSYPTTLLRIATVAAGTGAPSVMAGQIAPSIVKTFSGAENKGVLKAWSPNVVVLSFGEVHAAGPDALATYYQSAIDAVSDDPSVKMLFVAVPSEQGNDPSLLRQIARMNGCDLLSVPDNSSQTLTDAMSDLFIDRKRDKKGWKLVSTDSEQKEEGPAAAAIDGDTATYWHTQYDPKTDKVPHEIVVDMGESASIAGFRYLPRQDGGVNGRVKDYQFFVSDDGKTWTGPVASGSFPNTLDATRVKLKSPVRGRFFRFVEVSEMNGQPYGSAAEVDVILAR